MKLMLALALMLISTCSFAIPDDYLLQVETKIHRSPYSISVFATNPLYETLDCQIVIHGLTQNDEVITQKTNVPVRVGSYNFAILNAKNGNVFIDGKGEAYCRFFN